MTRTVEIKGGTIPLVGFGTWQLSGETAYEATRHALEVGYRHIDTATMYRNEDQVGRALRDSGVPRDEVFITTKFYFDRIGEERKVIEASLAALGVEHVDLWLVHWPPRNDGESVAIWNEFRAARDAGLTRSIGVSNYSLAQIDELVEATGEAPAVNQVPWSPAKHDAAFLAQSRERGVVIEGYSPLNDSDLSDPVFVSIAEKHGVSPAQVILRWHLEHDIVVLPRSSRKERVESNFALDFSLDSDDVARIDALGK
ncbi:putative oxidoreductase [Virgisporangium aliadipatigenens]|uniref:Putative oxidoreductase n=1 Tax=Virgisporangium aliadipatigenens TaxID=741659 RepID=A0A8J3YUD7_9ACTN|nr:aldo/keto reductase [Virgisporangium aliadipatigenens]GIJ49971.1 putative oxidoreductase [Virgisporangium aliadipatigenens]